MDMLLVTRPPTLTMRSAFFFPWALALLSIHCMRAVSAADSDDGHHRTAAEQEHVSSCPAPLSSTVVLQAAVEQLLREVGNLRRDMQELKAAAARPAPGTIVGSTYSQLSPWGSCPAGSYNVRLPSDQDYYYSLCIVQSTDVAASASSSAAAAAAAVAATAAAAVCYIAAEAAL